ncbi:heme peroxidase [Blastocladiella britannica]|nr:heme peroxidase [Blastocladiella britannica]
MQKKRMQTTMLLAILGLAAVATVYGQAVAPGEYRSFDGSGNNVAHMTWGMVNTAYLRAQVPTARAFNGSELANLRTVSNTVVRSTGDIPNARQLTVLHTFWGEFFIHDTAHVVSSRVPGDTYSVTVPDNDQFLPPGFNMSFTRAAVVNSSLSSAQRLSVNVQTHFIDGSHIYGQSDAQAAALRSGPFLKTDSTSVGPMPQTVTENPTGTNTSQTRTTSNRGTLFSFGAIVGNTSPYSQSLFTLFIREHNRYAAALKKDPANSGASDDSIFQRARQHVIAIIQHVTYYEYLPLLLGAPIDPYLKYDPNVRPEMDSFFTAVSYRFGHSEIPSLLSYVTPNNQSVKVDMAANFFRTELVSAQGIEPMFIGLATQVQNEMDIYYSEPMRSMIFGPQLGGLDGFVFDLFRARDYLIPRYGEVRQALGFSAPKTFSDISPQFASALAAAYPSVNDVDALIGGLLEPRDILGTNLGPMFTKSVGAQFKATRDGDRFWFESPGVLDEAHLAEIRATSLRDVIVRNAAMPVDALPANIWQITPQGSETTLGGIDVLPPGMTHVRQFAPGYRVAWSIEAGDTLHMIVQCAYAGFCAFGLGGGSMLTATEMYLVRNVAGAVTVSELKPTGRYERPVPASQSRAGPSPITVLSSKVFGKDPTNGFQIEFTRPVQPGNGREKLVSSGTQPMIFSFTVSGSSQITFHGSNRGAGTINFFTNEGTVGQGSLEDVEQLVGPLLVHAILMLPAFGLIFPSAVSISRYARTREGWLIWHVALQVIGGIAVIVAGGFSISVTVTGHSAHSIVGIILYTLVLIQLLFGFGNLRRMLVGGTHSFIPYIKLIHNNLGRFVLAAALVNIPLGLHVVYPVSTPGSFGSPWWIAYFVLGSFWVAFFGIMEARRILSSTANRGVRAIGSTDTLTRAVGVNGTQKANTRQVAAEIIVVKTDDLPIVTWSDIDQQVIEGKRWVVGNGLVFSLDQWVFSHPGGQAVLYSSFGTDITSDFFNNSKYDEDLFNPWVSLPNARESAAANRPAVPSMRRRRSGADPSMMLTDMPQVRTSAIAPQHGSLPRPRHGRNRSGDELGVGLSTGSANRKSMISDLAGIGNRDVEADPRILQEDWHKIIAARNQHFHSDGAVEKLKTLVVAKLDVAGQNRFVKEEYRRYALTAKELLSGPTAEAEVYRLKFCLLFPNELYEEDPLFLFPGQAVEIQMRIRGKYTSRYYTPCSGNMAAFEVVVKCINDGLFSTEFRRNKPGQMQYKIRGPFGSPLINVERPLPMQNGCWDELLCVGVGSGMTPHLQLISWYFLQTTFSLRPRAANVPIKANELAVHLNDKVFIRHPLQNGWVFARNADTGIDGMIHLSKLTPWIGRKPRLTVVNAAHNMASLIGSETLELVHAAYPDQVELRYLLTREEPEPLVAGGVRGFDRRGGRVDGPFLERLLADKDWIRQGQNGRPQKILLCGPEKFMNVTYSLLTDLGVPEEDVITLPAHSYLVNPHWQWKAIKFSMTTKSTLSTPVTSDPPATVLGGNGGGQRNNSSNYGDTAAPQPFTASQPAGSIPGYYPILAQSVDSNGLFGSSLPSNPGRFGGDRQSEQEDDATATYNGGGDESDPYMSADAYAACLPPMPVRADPRSNEPQWFFLPSESMSRTRG